MMETDNYQQLSDAFSKNGLPYNLIQRNEVVALYAVGGTYYPDRTHYEVIRIIRLPKREIMGRLYPAHEAMPSNEQFGKEGSRAIVDRDRAEAYFHELSEKLETAHDRKLTHDEAKTPLSSISVPQNAKNIGS